MRSAEDTNRELNRRCKSEEWYSQLDQWWADLLAYLSEESSDNPTNPDEILAMRTGKYSDNGLRTYETYADDYFCHIVRMININHDEWDENVVTQWECDLAEYVPLHLC